MTTGMNCWRTPRSTCSRCSSEGLSERSGTQFRGLVRAEQRAAADRPHDERFYVAQRQSPREPAPGLGVRRRKGVPMTQKVTPCLWFDGQAEQAARYYVSLLPDSRIDRVVRSPADTPSGPAGMVLVVEL